MPTTDPVTAADAAMDAGEPWGYDAFAAAVPCSAAGIARKFEVLDSALESVEDGEELPPELAAILRRHLASLRKGVLGPRIVAP